MQFFFFPAGVVIADVCFGVYIDAVFVAYPIKQTRTPTITKMPMLYIKKLFFIETLLHFLKTLVQIHEHEAFLNVF